MGATIVSWNRPGRHNARRSNLSIRGSRADYNRGASIPGAIDRAYIGVTDAGHGLGLRPAGGGKPPGQSDALAALFCSGSITTRALAPKDAGFGLATSDAHVFC